MMKLIDKLLKKLNVDRNTFFTFILTLISFYICIDRVVEMLLMIFTGVSSSYWGPFKYTLALACPAFAFAFSGTAESMIPRSFEIVRRLALSSIIKRDFIGK